MQRPGRRVGWLATADVERAQDAHRDAQLDVDHVVARAAPVGEAGVVAAEHAEAVLLSRERRRRDRGVQAQHFRGRRRRRLVDPLDAGQECGDEVGAREVGRRLHAGAAEQISSIAGSVGLVT